MAWSAPLLDRSAVEGNCALVPQTAPTAQGWCSVYQQPSGAGRDSMDSSERGPLSGPAGELSPSFDLLAAATELESAGRVAENQACVSERVGRTSATEVERVVPGREFCSCEQMDAGVEKPNRARDEVVGRSRRPRSASGKYLHSTSPGEVRLAETTLAAIQVGRRHRAGRPR
jgi:hypothetical protein